MVQNRTAHLAAALLIAGLLVGCAPERVAPTSPPSSMVPPLTSGETGSPPAATAPAADDTVSSAATAPAADATVSPAAATAPAADATGSPAPSSSTPAPATPNAAPSSTPLPPAGSIPTMPPAVIVTPTTAPRAIVIDSPASGDTLSSPFAVRGRAAVTPFEATLTYRVYDATGVLVGAGAVMVSGDLGLPGTFDAPVMFAGATPGPGRVEVLELSARDGSVVVSAAVDIVLAAPAGAAVEVPAAGAPATLPLHILARTARAGEQVTASLSQAGGPTLSQSFETLQGEDGRGLLATNLDWNSESQPPEFAAGPATLELRDATGVLLAAQQLVLLPAGDPNTQQIKLYWALDGSLQEVIRRVPRTERIGAAALDELLWGPTPGNLAGFETAIPTPEEVLVSAARQPGWGQRVTLRRLTIVDGVATADFSPELRAYGGGSARVLLIREQIERTLRQFPSVREVRILVDGQPDALQP